MRAMVARMSLTQCPKLGAAFPLENMLSKMRLTILLEV